MAREVSFAPEEGKGAVGRRRCPARVIAAATAWRATTRTSPRREIKPTPCRAPHTRVFRTVVCRPATGLPTVTPRFSVCFASFEFNRRATVYSPRAHPPHSPNTRSRVARLSRLYPTWMSSARGLGVRPAPRVDASSVSARRTRASTRTMASTARGHAAPILARRRRGAPGRAARVAARAAPRTWATPRRGETLAGCLRASPSAFPPTTTRGTRSFPTRPRAAVGGGLAGRPEDGEDGEDTEDDERAPSDPFASFASDHPPRDAARDDDFSSLRDAESDLARGPDDPDDPNASSDPNRAAAASDDSASSAETPSSAAGALAVEYACGPGQLKLNLLAAACGTQNPNNAGVLRDFLESLRAANASANAAPFVGGGGASSSSTQHGWWHDFFFHAPTEPFHGRWASELTFVAHHPLAFSGVVFAAVLAHLAWRRQRSRVMALKADFLADGVDLTRVDDRVETLTYLREMKKKERARAGTRDGGGETRGDGDHVPRPGGAEELARVLRREGHRSRARRGRREGQGVRAGRALPGGVPEG